MLTELIKTLYQYNAWANTQILDTTARLNAEQFLASQGASYESVRETLVHLMSAQWIYLARWQGSSPRTMLEAHQFPDLASIRTRWSEIEGETCLEVSVLVQPIQQRCSKRFRTAGSDNRAGRYAENCEGRRLRHR